MRRIKAGDGGAAGEGREALPRRVPISSLAAAGNVASPHPAGPVVALLPGRRAALPAGAGLPVGPALPAGADLTLGAPLIPSTAPTGGEVLPAGLEVDFFGAALVVTGLPVVRLTTFGFFVDTQLEFCKLGLPENRSFDAV